MARHQFDETEAGWKKLAAEAQEKHRELEQLNAEIRSKTGERDQIVAEIQKIRSLVQQQW
jgi:hypothetical protein